MYTYIVIPTDGIEHAANAGLTGGPLRPLLKSLEWFSFHSTHVYGIAARAGVNISRVEENFRIAHFRCCMGVIRGIGEKVLIGMRGHEGPNFLVSYRCRCISQIPERRVPRYNLSLLSFASRLWPCLDLRIEFICIYIQLTFFVALKIPRTKKAPTLMLMVRRGPCRNRLRP